MWIVMIKSLRYYIKSLCIKKCHTLMKFRIRMKVLLIISNNNNNNKDIKNYILRSFMIISYNIIIILYISNKIKILYI